MSPRRWLLAAVLLLLTAGVTALLVAPPAPVWDLFADDSPSPVMGDPAPSVNEQPLARVAIAGDTGTGDAGQRATAHAMDVAARDHPFDALVLLGDLVYEDGEARLTRSRVLTPYEELFDDGAELVAVLGNHDYESGEQSEILEQLGREHPWYVEWVGPVRVVALDSNRVEDDAQTEWLHEVLSEPVPTGTWTVVAMHHPPYSAGYHGSDTAVRRAWADLFADAGVALVLAGHDHDYQRSVPLSGVTYVVSGAGAKLRPTGQQDFTAVSASRLHFVDLLVYEGRLVARALDESGRLLDQFSLRRR